MALNCCGVCMYGKNEHKYTDLGKNECMLDGYTPHDLSYCCKKFKRDLKKKLIVKSIKSI